MPLHVSSTSVRRQEAKIVLYNLWYHHTETTEWSKITKITKITKIQFYKYEHTVAKFTHKFYYYVFILIELYFRNFSSFSNFRPSTCFSVMKPRGCIVQFWPPDDEHVCSRHVEI